MSRAGDDGLESNSGDDLIELHVTRTTSSRSLLNPRSAMNPQLPSAAGTRSAAAASRRPPPDRLSSSRVSSRAQTSRPQSLRPSRTPQADTTVIDLTEEPDSPVERRRPPQGQQQEQQQQRNPRRTNSQRTSPPRLSRSDSTFMAPQPNLIDLTVDSPEDERRLNPEHFWRSQRSHLQQQHQRHHFRRAQLPADQLIQLEFINHQQQSLASDLARGLGRTLAGFFNGEIIRGNFNAPEFDVSRIVPQREDSPKPPMEPAPPTREGFTRDTCAEPDQEKVVVCPACNEELAYHPAGSTSQTPATKKRKRSPGEHHFWALKKCGHVYCAECFENRRPTKLSPNGAGFPVAGNKPPTGPNSDVRCAVDGCETKVAAKTEWVGIFL